MCLIWLFMTYISKDMYVMYMCHKRKLRVISLIFFWKMHFTCEIAKKKKMKLKQWRIWEISFWPRSWRCFVCSFHFSHFFRSLVIRDFLSFYRICQFWRFFRRLENIIWAGAIPSSLAHSINLPLIKRISTYVPG